MKPREEALLPHYAKHLDYSSPAHEKALRRMLEKCGFCPESIRSVLDVGCGDGRASWLGEIYCGFDYCAERIDKAIRTQDRGFFRVGDVYEVLPKIPEQSFDLVLLIEVLEHLEEPLEVVNEAKRIGRTTFATVPINMPYTAHLQVYKSRQQVEERLQPDLLKEHEGHFLLAWAHHDLQQD